MNPTDSKFNDVVLMLNHHGRPKIFEQALVKYLNLVIKGWINCRIYS